MVNLNKDVLCSSVEGSVSMDTRWKYRIHTLGYQLSNNPLPNPNHEKCTEFKARENNYNCGWSCVHNTYSHCILNAKKRLSLRVEEKYNVRVMFKFHVRLIT